VGDYYRAPDHAPCLSNIDTHPLKIDDLKKIKDEYLEKAGIIEYEDDEDESEDAED